MTRAFIATLILAAALPAFASFYPVFSTDKVAVAVGEVDKSVIVSAQWTGFAVLQPFEWDFRSNNERVAVVHGHVERTGTPITIRGIAPGVAYIRTGGDGWYLKIVVYCADEVPVRAERPIVVARTGESVTLRAVSEIAQRTTFNWYAGRIGDTSHPLALGVSELAFTATEPEAEYVWVLATTTCSASSAEFRIEPAFPRRRSVRR